MAIDSSGMGNHGVYRPELGVGPVLGRPSVHDTLYATFYVNGEPLGGAALRELAEIDR